MSYSEKWIFELLIITKIKDFNHFAIMIGNYLESKFRGLKLAQEIRKKIEETGAYKSKDRRLFDFLSGTDSSHLIEFRSEERKGLVDSFGDEVSPIELKEYHSRLKEINDAEKWYESLPKRHKEFVDILRRENMPCAS